MNEKKELTITQILDDIKTEICDDYCRHPYQFSDEEQEDLGAICEHCPLERI